MRRKLVGLSMMIMLGIFLLGLVDQVRAQATQNDLQICRQEFGDVAIAACTRLIASGRLTKPGLAEAYNNRCYVHAIAGNLQTALVDCSESLRLNPNSHSSLDSRGFTYLKLGKLDLAITDFDAALRLEPKKSNSLYGRGVARLRLGDVGRGNEDIAAAKSINPKVAEEYAKYGVR